MHRLVDRAEDVIEFHGDGLKTVVEAAFRPPLRPGETDLRSVVQLGRITACWRS